MFYNVAAVVLQAHWYAVQDECSHCNCANEQMHRVGVVGDFQG